MVSMVTYEIRYYIYAIWKANLEILGPQNFWALCGRTDRTPVGPGLTVGLAWVLASCVHPLLLNFPNSLEYFMWFICNPNQLSNWGRFRQNWPFLVSNSQNELPTKLFRWSNSLAWRPTARHRGLIARHQVPRRYGIFLRGRPGPAGRMYGAGDKGAIGCMCGAVDDGATGRLYGAVDKGVMVSI
jgi:hypothetical protein